MAVEKMTENVEVVQTLSTYPNQEEGLSAEQLKAKFDQGPKALKEYLNNVLVPAVQGIQNAMDAGAQYGLDTTLSVPGRAADAGAVGTALAGKAPAGYGLGEKLTQVTHIDNAGKNGFYQVNGSVASGHPFDYGAANILVVGGSADLMPTQIGFGISMNPTTNNAMAIRASDGIWEWFNPPMKVGEEYRTTERWEGKTVYAKCVDFGTLPNTEEKMVYHGISGVDKIIYASATAWVGNEVMIINSNTYYITDFRAGQNAVAIRTNADMTSWTNCVFTLKYTKN